MHASAEPDDANASADGDGSLDRSLLSFLDADPDERDRLLEERRENDLTAWRYETHDDFRRQQDHEVEPLGTYLSNELSRIRWAKDGPDVADPLANALGRIRFRPHYADHRNFEDITRKLDGMENLRLFFYQNLSPLAEYRVALRLDLASVRDDLGLSANVSQSTLNRIPERMEELGWREHYEAELESAVRNLQKKSYADYVRDPEPETLSSDGEGVPEVKLLSRKLRRKTYPYIQFDRDESVEHSKNALLHALITAAARNRFVTDVAANLDLKPWLDPEDIPTGRTILHHVEKASREQITRMFMASNKELFDLVDDHGYFPEKAEVAIDITDWPYFGNPDADRFISGTKPGRNSAFAWQYATLAVVGNHAPITLAVQPVRVRRNKAYVIRRLVRFAESFVDVERMYLDSGFFQSDVSTVLDERDIEFVTQGKKAGDAIKDLLWEGVEMNADYNMMQYGVGDVPDDKHTVFGIPATKKSELRKSRADDWKPIDDWTVFYTNVEDPEPLKLAADFRNRWSIETGYRVIKNEFLPKSKSRNHRVRLFYFNFACLLYNSWTAANVLQAEESGHDLAEDGKAITAARFLQSMEDDEYDIDVADERDFSEVEEVQSGLNW